MKIPHSSVFTDPPFFLVWKSDGGHLNLSEVERNKFSISRQDSKSISVIHLKNTFMFMWVSVFVTLLALIGNAHGVPEINILES